MTDRFVILHHELNDGEHWDLMLERGDVLLTWQLLREPVSIANLPIVAVRIGDHRKDYLEYEGPISGNRGSVRRVDAGAVSFLQATDSRYDLILEGGRLAGRLILEKCESRWVLRLADKT